MARLILISAPDPLEYPITGPVFTVGRGPDNDLILADDRIAPHHARIISGPGRPLIASVAGPVMVNGTPAERHELGAGDLIRIGDSELRYEEGGDQAEAEPERTAAEADAFPPAEELFALDPSPTMTGPDFDLIVSSGRPGLDSCLYPISHVLISVPSLAQSLKLVLTLLLQVTSARRGLVVRRDATGELEVIASSRRPGEAAPDLARILAVVRRSLEERTVISCHDECYVPSGDGEPEPAAALEEIRSALCLPLEDAGNLWGALYLDSPGQSNAFSEPDLKLISTTADLITLAAEREQGHAQMAKNLMLKATLERFHSPDVAAHMLEQMSQAQGFDLFLTEREVTILFADICGSTALLEQLAPPEAAQLLNHFFDEMTAIVFKYWGTVDKFIGDAVMATFGAPISHGNDAELAVFAAIEMMRQLGKFHAARPARQHFEIRIGINTGVVIAGYMGSRRRLEYTVLGDPVNVASRLASLALPGTIYIGESTLAKISAIFDHRERGDHQLKGKRKKTRVYEIIY
jgi:adenylate cyclase